MNKRAIYRKHRTSCSWFSGPKPKSLEEQLSVSEKEIDVSIAEYQYRYKKLERAFEDKTSLTRFDMSILVFAAVLQSLRWYIVDNSSFKTDSKTPDKTVDNIGSFAKDHSFPKLAEIITDHHVPYDAVKRTDKFKEIYGENTGTGLSGFNHRYKALGHDPVFGWIIGPANIVTNTVTVNDFPLYSSYLVENGSINDKTDIFHVLKWTGQIIKEHPTRFGAAFVKQAIHYGTDFFTRQSLPLPIVNLSPETSRFLMGKDVQIDLYTVTRAIMLSVVLNKIVEAFHRLFCDTKNKDSDYLKQYEVRTTKIVMYSNVMSSLVNAAYVGVSGNLTKMDVGGYLVTVWRLLNDSAKINRIKHDFILKELDNQFRTEEDEVKNNLSALGYDF